MKPPILFKNLSMLIVFCTLVIIAAYNLASAVVIMPRIVLPKQQQGATESSNVSCWHAGMGPADFCDPFFTPDALKFASLTN